MEKVQASAVKVTAATENVVETNTAAIVAFENFTNAVNEADALALAGKPNLTAPQKAQVKATLNEMSTRSDWPKWAGMFAIFGGGLIWALKRSGWLAKKQKESVEEAKKAADEVVPAVEKKEEAKKEVAKEVAELEKNANDPVLQEQVPATDIKEEPSGENKISAAIELQAQIEQTEKDLQKVRDAINAIRAQIPRASDRENEYNLQYRGNLPKGQDFPSRPKINKLKDDRRDLIREERALEKKLAALRNGDALQAPQAIEGAGVVEDQPVVVVGPQAWAQVTQEGLDQVVSYLRKKLGEAGFVDVWGIFVKDDKVSYMENFQAGVDLYNEQQAVVKDLPEAKMAAWKEEASALKELGSALDLIAANIEEMAQRKELDQKLVDRINMFKESQLVKQGEENPAGGPAEEIAQKPADKPVEEPAVTPVVENKAGIIAQKLAAGLKNAELGLKTIGAGSALPGTEKKESRVDREKGRLAQYEKFKEIFEAFGEKGLRDYLQDHTLLDDNKDILGGRELAITEMKRELAAIDRGVRWTDEQLVKMEFVISRIPEGQMSEFAKEVVSRGSVDVVKEAVELEIRTFLSDKERNNLRRIFNEGMNSFVAMPLTQRAAV